MKRAFVFVLAALASSLLSLSLVRNIPLPQFDSSVFIVGLKPPQILPPAEKLEKTPEEIQQEIQARRAQAKLERQLECLARNVYYEARGEPYAGKIAVAQVTVNRARSGKFPDDICAVVYQKTRSVDNSVICQFSWWCMPHVKSQPISRREYAESQRIARRVLIEGEELPQLRKALFFHASYISPGWNRERVAHIGQHIFYR